MANNPNRDGQAEPKSEAGPTGSEWIEWAALAATHNCRSFPGSNHGIIGP
jgi:hypothetical protein